MSERLQEWVSFGAFRLDLRGGKLTSGGEVVTLRRKSAEVLCHLASHAASVISIDELLDSCWSDVAVTPQTVTNVMYELRRTLATAGGDPGWIQSVPRRGYRFIAPVRTEEAESTTVSTPAFDTDTLGVSPAIFVGRQEEISFLSQCWQQACRGAARMVFVAGEPGIGKTTLINEFVKGLQGGNDRSPQAAAADRFLLAHGRCVPQHLEAEPYMPVLEALEQLAHDATVVEIMHRHAPAWLVQMPWLLADAERESLRASLMGIGSARMLREGKRLFVELAQQTPLIVILEDVHWADHATVDLMRGLAAASDSGARLLFIVTYRSRELAQLNHPLRDTLGELLSWNQNIARLNLDSLAVDAVREYVVRRFETRSFDAVATFLNEKSGGNALFFKAMADYLCARGTIVRRAEGWELATADADLEVGIPDGLREMIHMQLRRLETREGKLLEAAAACGADFTAIEVAAGLEWTAAEVDEACEQIAERTHFIHRVGEYGWPDGEVTDRYRFTHAIYQQAVVERMSTSRRRDLHARIGVQLERRYDARAREIAPRLAAHFEAAGDVVRQAKYLELSTLLAFERYAYREASAYIDRTLAVLSRLPESPETTARQIEWHLERGNVAHVTCGYAEGADSYLRALALARHARDTILEFRARLGLLATSLLVPGTSNELPHTLAQAAELRAIAERGHPGLATAAYAYSALAASINGDHLRALAETEAAQRMLPQAMPNVPRRVSLELIIEGLMVSSLSLLGRLDEARRRRATVAREFVKARSVLIHRQLALLSLNALMTQDTDEALELAEKTIAAAVETGLDACATIGNTVRETILAHDPAVDLTRLINLIDAPSPLLEGVWHAPALIAHLADHHRRRGDFVAARARIQQALALNTQYCGSDLWRMKGEIDASAAEGATAKERRRLRSAAEECFRKSLDLARQQSSKLYELRAARSLARLLDDDPSWAQLQRVYDSFTEGFAAPDLVEAAQLLAKRP